VSYPYPDQSRQQQQQQQQQEEEGEEAELAAYDPASGSAAHSHRADDVSELGTDFQPLGLVLASGSTQRSANAGMLQAAAAPAGRGFRNRAEVVAPRHASYSPRGTSYVTSTVKSASPGAPKARGLYLPSSAPRRQGPHYERQQEQQMQHKSHARRKLPGHTSMDRAQLQLLYGSLDVKGGARTAVAWSSSLRST